MLDEKLLEILVCPKCRGDLEYRPQANQLICQTCRLVYRIEDDIPVMLINEAEPLQDSTD